MKYIRHILPLLAILLATLLILHLFYVNITSYEEDRCWQELESTVAELKNEIRIKFTDEISKLHLLKTIMTYDDINSADSVSHLYLNRVQSGTMFARIDVLYPDNTLISNGERIELDDQISFDRIKSKGEYLTNRKTDFINGKPCVYYVLPILEGSEVAAVLIGVIDCETLNELFRPVISDGAGNICIIDSDDGNYIMDDWHRELGNIYEMEDRELLPEYAHIDFRADIIGQKTGAIAFVSKTTGHDLYMYYAPLDIFGWELAVFTSDDVIFANLAALRRSFIAAGIIEVFLLLMYCLWNVYLFRKLQRANSEIREKQEKLEFFSYHDMLTGLYNRHKYFETLSMYMRRRPPKTGVVYADLNGLKHLNDTYSHEEGDAYLCAAAGALTETFGDCAYRIGGDEFVVILSDIPQDVFEEKLRALDGCAAQQGISLSVGSLWQADCDDIGEMLRRAEQEMYQRKKAHHRALNDGSV